MKMKYGDEVEIDERFIPFNIILLNKRQEVMKFTCFYVNTDVEIHRIKVFKTYYDFIQSEEVGKDKSLLNKGINFYKLNKILQENFVALLEELDLDANIGKYVKYLGINKEKKMYIKWLNDCINLLNIQ